MSGQWKRRCCCETRRREHRHAPSGLLHQHAVNYVCAVPIPLLPGRSPVCGFCSICVCAAVCLRLTGVCVAGVQRLTSLHTHIAWDMDDGGYTTQAEQDGPYGSNDWHCTLAQTHISLLSTLTFHTCSAHQLTLTQPSCSSTLSPRTKTCCSLPLIRPYIPGLKLLTLTGCAGYAFNRHDAWTNMHDWGCFNWNWVHKMHRRQDPEEKDKYFL
jgi:hypothetical protein